MQNFFWPSSSQRNEDFCGGATFMFATFFDCTAGKIADLPSTFWYFSAVSGSYLRPGRSKGHTLKGQNHLLDVTNAGKPWGRVQLHQGGQECVRKDHYWRNCARAGNFLGRSYCLQVANMLMFPLTAKVPINR